MKRILTLAAATAVLVACGSDGDRGSNAAGEPSAVNGAAAAPPDHEAAALPAANGAAAVPAATGPSPTGPGPGRAEAIPPAFRGVYDSDRTACAGPSEYRLTVSDRELRFHESIGTVRSVAVDGPEAIRVTADYQGEGESWRNVRALRLTDGGETLMISGEGTRLTRVRCGSSPG